MYRIGECGGDGSGSKEIQAQGHCLLKVLGGCVKM